MLYCTFQTLTIFLVTKGATETCSTPEKTMGWREELFELILADDHNSLDPLLSGSVSELKARGAHRCWHKHSTFLEHLVGVHNILRLWGQGRKIGRVGLFHSAYSNSYVNLALFDPNKDSERKIMSEMVGAPAEDIIHMFCIIDRQKVVVDTLLKGGFIPPQGLSVPHLRHTEVTVFLSADTLRMLVVFTMADLADQYFGWQDRLFGGEELVNSMLLPNENPSSHDSRAIWPGLSQPGIWMSYVSQLGAVARTFQSIGDAGYDPDDQRLADLPPVFDNCSKVLTRDDEMKARDLYWTVVMGEIKLSNDIIATLETAVTFNPWAFEPYVLLAQKYLHENNFNAALGAAERALELQLQWGTAWDKRLSFAAWVAWTRVMYQRAEAKLDWPENSWEVNNFGLVH